MPVLKLQGIEVSFPFEPTWSRVSSCLFCEARHTSPMPDITVNKPDELRAELLLSQTVKELKNTDYRARSAVLGSRDQLCVHPEVKTISSNAAKTRVCKIRVNAHDCSFYQNVDPVFRDVDADLATNPHPALDLEDLVQLGERRHACPYFLSRSMQSGADVILLPYNYLIDKQTRASQGIDLNGAVVIFDEAHNIESSCEEAASFDLTSADLAGFLTEIDQLLRVADADRPELSEDRLLLLKKAVLDLEAALDRIELKNGGFKAKGDYMYQFFAEAGISSTTHHDLSELLEQCVMTLLQQQANATGRCYLSKFQDVLKVAFSDAAKTDPRVLEKFYYVHVEEKANRSSQKKTSDWSNSMQKLDKRTVRTLSLWCFSPAFAMKSLMAEGIKTLILTSGTLAPLNSFKAELMTDFPVMLENPHIITGKQVWAGVLPVGPSNARLISNYENRNLPAYKNELGNSLVNFSRIVPAGLLVFFPSYGVMASCVEAWQQPSSTGACIWDRLSQYKTVIVEPREKHEFVAAMHAFYDKIQDPALSGAIFLAVCRGKVSEGLDFANSNGRAVIITGLPYPAVKEPRVVLKRQYMDDACRRRATTLSGQDWYQMQATRAVNQAIGRVIRHRQDYGAIILADSRFADERQRACLPKWLQKHVEVFTKFGEAQRSLTLFFRRAKADPELLSAEQDALREAALKASAPPSHALLGEGTFAAAGRRAARSTGSSRGGVDGTGATTAAPALQIAYDFSDRQHPALQATETPTRPKLVDPSLLQPQAARQPSSNSGGPELLSVPVMAAPQSTARASVSQQLHAAGRSLYQKPGPEPSREDHLSGGADASAVAAATEQRKEAAFAVLKELKRVCTPEKLMQAKQYLKRLRLVRAQPSRKVLVELAVQLYDATDGDSNVLSLIGEQFEGLSKVYWDSAITRLDGGEAPEVVKRLVEPEAEDARAAKRAKLRAVFDEIGRLCGEEAVRRTQEHLTAYRRATPTPPLATLFSALQEALERDARALQLMEGCLPPSKQLEWRRLQTPAPTT
ncbi:uncharacterized protein MONBRDRAFT_27129 [Monosiga brevicollis MX1]|uniref:Regulator of telomere elongation helicase 1 homolog n=1 Tax=Monosiga brevicollis TaxID=81824 RepID=A9V4D9_MONBE|nr:uncharacterized protein MONBRDRAFT_27129 [Monosiga brevicollis MX1]EDQ87598.1 predicted protein [Monosiga brevicollis MX1]|eukprot:XP_001747518.1 hypothetical protein [Monosiga brevicollis MX1]